MNDIFLQRREKGSKIMSLVPCPKAVRLYNSGMGGVDVMDQRTAAYRLDRKSSVIFYLRIFFDLMDIACVNSYLIYNLKHPNKINNISIRKFVMKGKKQPFSLREKPVSDEILAKLCNILFLNCFNPTTSVTKC